MLFAGSVHGLSLSFSPALPSKSIHLVKGVKMCICNSSIELNTVLVHVVLKL